LGRIEDARRDLQSALQKLPRLTADRELLTQLDKAKATGADPLRPEREGA
jgi:hypothetical protein